MWGGAGGVQPPTRGDGRGLWGLTVELGAGRGTAGSSLMMQEPGSSVGHSQSSAGREGGRHALPCLTLRWQDAAPDSPRAQPCLGAEHH